jgi:hypothetical protein
VMVPDEASPVVDASDAWGAERGIKRPLQDAPVLGQYWAKRSGHRPRRASATSTQRFGLFYDVLADGSVLADFDRAPPGSLLVRRGGRFGSR